MSKSKPRTIKCKLCPKIESNPTALMKHIQDNHRKSDIDEHSCPLCNQSFDTLWTLGRHLSVCFQKDRGTETMENDFIQTTKDNLRKCQELSNEAGFDFVLKLAKNMNVPRNSVFEVTSNVKNFLKLIGEGMKDLAIPLLKEDKVHEFENIVSIMMNESLKNVDTEFKFDKCLSAKQLIQKGKLRQAPIPDPSIMDVDEDETDGESIDDDISDDIGDNSDDNSDDDYDSDNTSFGNDSDEDDDASDNTTHANDGDDVSSRCKAKTATLMDIQFQIKSFFELPDVFKKIKDNNEEIKKTKKLNHFINGKIWKRKLENFKKDDIVLPYHLHIDDTQMNNSLGTHTTNGAQTCVYYSFPTIPNEYNARLDTIFTALLFECSLSKKYGNDKCYDALVKELNKLSDDGIIINVDGKEQKIFFAMGLLLGDNKGVNDCLGFAKGFRAYYYCRFCRLHRWEMEVRTNENINDLRNKENYDEDLLIGNGQLTGIYENSPFNKIRYFHVTDSCADIMHDVNEGILHYNVCEVILHCIKQKYFNLAMLNDEKRKKDYGDLEENNKSTDIKIERLKKRKLTMTASESYSFVHHLPFILSNIIEAEKREQLRNDEVWRFLLITIRFLDMCYATSYDRSSINMLRGIITTMHEMYVRLFEKTLKPKHHFATHYPTLIKKFGPLRYLSSMRYEAKHRFLKNYAKNTICRKNLSFSLGRKLQYEFAYFLQSKAAFEDYFKVSKPKNVAITDEEFFPFFIPSTELNTLAEQTIYVCDKVKINGLTLSSNLYLPYMNGNELQLLKIVKLLMLSTDDETSITIIYQKYAEVTYCSLYASYEVKNLLPEMDLMNISDVFCQRMLPVVLHDVVGSKMFRYKTY